MKINMTKGSPFKSIFLFSLPIMVGSLLQQFYNIADTFIVAKFVGTDALAAVGSSYTLMVFITSIILGLCLGSSVVLSVFFGSQKYEKFKLGLVQSFIFIGIISILLFIFCFFQSDFILKVLQTPKEIYQITKDYIQIIFLGILFTFLYNYFASILRSIGNSLTPLIMLAIASILNIVLDYYFIVPLQCGVKGAAIATIIAQAVSGIGLAFYCLFYVEEFKIQRQHLIIHYALMSRIIKISSLSCLQQSIMNFGILMIQGLVNSFGVNVMAAFSAGVKIDSFAYLPVQDFGNAFSTYIAQNKGANLKSRITKGLKSSIVSITIACFMISAIVYFMAKPLIGIFIDPSQTEIIQIGVNYLHIEGCCYIGIGYLFLLYGLYRGLEMMHMSIILTVISLGTRVALSYLLVSFLGLNIIWWSIPIGWLLADIVGFVYYIYKKPIK